MDECDRASAYAERFNKKALEKVLEKGLPCGESLFECVDCGDEIPEGRRKAMPGCVRYVKCAGIHERNGF